MSLIARILKKFEEEATPYRGRFGKSEILPNLNATDVGICDLAELQRKTDQEYVLLVRQISGGERRVLIRGQKHRVEIPSYFLDSETIWYAHSHPRDDQEASDADRHALEDFSECNGQKQSVIVTESGNCSGFQAVRDMSSWVPP